MDTTSYFAGNSDKCPKCGAAKVFSALRCPACGTEYAAAAPNRSAGGANAGFTSTSAGNFDLNASFSAYKKSIEPQAEAAEAAAVGAAAGIVAAGVAGAANTAAQGANSGLSDIAELNKPVELDPIARKLQEMSNQNSASAPRPGVYIPGASNQSSSYQASQTQSSSYQSQQFQGTQSQAAPAPGVWYPGMPAQSNAGQGAQNANNAGASGQGAAPQGMRFQGRPQEAQVGGYTGAQGASPYASPYASPNYGASYGGSITEKPKKSIGSKIFVAILLLGLAALIGYGFYRYNNSDKNENGVSYTEGKAEYGTYVNEWADLKIDMTGDFENLTPYLYTGSMQSSINSLSYQWKDKDVEVKGIFLTGKEYHDGFANGPLPAVMMYVITDNSFNAKLFGAKTEDFFQEYRVTGGGYSLTVSKSSDIVLCGKTYKTFVSALPMGNGSNITMYMCVRAIGNKIVLLYLYDIPGYFDLNTVKSLFVD